MTILRTLRVALFGCPVCGKPAWHQALGHGRQRHLTFCRYAR